MRLLTNLIRFGRTLARLDSLFLDTATELGSKPWAEGMWGHVEVSRCYGAAAFRRAAAAPHGALGLIPDDGGMWGHVAVGWW